jgi:hypothetical protein
MTERTLIIILLGNIKAFEYQICCRYVLLELDACLDSIDSYEVLLAHSVHELHP